MKKRILLSIVALVGMLFCVAACDTAGTSDKPKDSALLAWETTEELSLELGTQYKVLNDIVADSTGKEFSPSYSVYQADGQEVVLINSYFLANDLDGYTIKYSIIDNGNKYEKLVEVNVTDTKAPEIICSQFVDSFLGFDYEFQKILIIDNSNEDIIPNLKLTLIDGNAEQIIDCTSEGFTPSKVGEYKLLISATDGVGNTTQIEREFSIAPFDGTIQNFDNEATFKTDFSLQVIGTEWLEEFEGKTGVAKGTYAETWAYWPYWNFQPLYSDLSIYDAFDFVEITMYIEQSEAGVRKMKFLGNDHILVSTNQWITVRVPIKNFIDSFSKLSGTDTSKNGINNFYNDATYKEGDNNAPHFSFYIDEIKAIAEANFVFEDYAKEAMRYEEYTIPNVTVIYEGKEVVDADVQISATLKGNTVAVSAGEAYKLSEEGELVITYAYGGVEESITITVGPNGQVIKDENADTAWLTSKDDGVAIISKPSNIIYTGAGAEGLKGSKYTFGVELGDLTNYDTVEFTIGVYNYQGTPMTFSMGNVSVDFLWSHDAKLRVPVNQVGDLILTQPSGLNREHAFIIRKVVGIYEETIAISNYATTANTYTEFTIPTANVTFAGEVVSGKTVVQTAEFNGATVDITSGKFTTTTAGTLVVTYACGSLVATATIDFVIPKTLLTDNGMENATDTLTQWTVPSWNQFGEYKGSTFDALKLTGNGSTKFNLTFKASFVEELKKYDYVELTIVYEGQSGAPISFEATGTSTVAGGNGVITLEFATEGWDGTIGCCPENPTWTSYYYVYVADVIGIGLAKDKLITENVMENATDTLTQWTVPSWNQFGEYKGSTFDALKLTGNGSTKFNLTFKDSFVEELKKYDYVELTIVYEGQSGAPISFEANGTSTVAGGNGVITLKFATEGWDGTIGCCPENPTWTSYYYVYVAMIVAYNV